MAKRRFTIKKVSTEVTNYIRTSDGESSEEEVFVDCDAINSMIGKENETLTYQFGYDIDIYMCNLTDKLTDISTEINIIVESEGDYTNEETIKMRELGECLMVVGYLMKHIKTYSPHGNFKCVLRY